MRQVMTSWAQLLIVLNTNSQKNKRLLVLCSTAHQVQFITVYLRFAKRTSNALAHCHNNGKSRLYNEPFHSRPQGPGFFWSAPRKSMFCHFGRPIVINTGSQNGRKSWGKKFILRKCTKNCTHQTAWFEKIMVTIFNSVKETPVCVLRIDGFSPSPPLLNITSLISRGWKGLMWEL